MSSVYGTISSKICGKITQFNTDDVDVRRSYSCGHNLHPRAHLRALMTRTYVAGMCNAILRNHIKGLRAATIKLSRGICFGLSMTFSSS